MDKLNKPRWVVVAFAAVIALVFLCFVGLSARMDKMQEQMDTIAAENAELRELNSSEFVECGMCGAHVHDWWYVANSYGQPVEVCHDCYMLVFDAE